MDRELIDRAWRVLPAEFRKEVKREYRKGYVCETLAMLITLFGHHNLTSDAEGEDEMLCVSRKEVQKMYSAFEEFKEKDNTCFNLETLFGSKCLPDELPEDNFAKSGPKYGSDDKVTLNGCGGFVITSSYLDPYTREYKYRLGGFKGHFCESDLEAYSEPGKEPLNLSQETANCDKHFDNILKDSFAKERRLNIATTIIEHIIKSGYYSLSEKYREDNIKEMVKVSLQITDTIMAECEKGGVK